MAVVDILPNQMVCQNPNADGRRAILEIVGFWTPEYLDEKLAKIRDADLDHLLLAVSERLECSPDDFEGSSNRVLWFKSGIHVYDVVDLADEHAITPVEAHKQH